MSRFSADVEELAEEFRLADRNGDGRINWPEFRALLDGLEAGMSERDMRIGFGEVDTDNDGLIDVEEFIAWWRGD
ncbi:MAG: histidine kinase [Proteobacteria bacterium]|nr:MAG: histidine kinase [Pseudomonadota bacterium]